MRFRGFYAVSMETDIGNSLNGVKNFELFVDILKE
jgi:hypothetical protein